MMINDVLNSIEKNSYYYEIEVGHFDYTFEHRSIAFAFMFEIFLSESIWIFLAYEE